MNGTILNEIRILRGTGDFSVNKNNSNRYRLLVNEDNGTATSYYFSTPIYNIRNKRLVNREFREGNSIFQTEGSNAEISVNGGEITLKNDEGTVTVTFAGMQQFSQSSLRSSGNTLVSNGSEGSAKIELIPTINGVAVKARDTGGELSLRIRTDKPFTKLRNNTKYFALMSEDFRPFLTVSAIGVSESSAKQGSFAGNIFGESLTLLPVEVSCQKIDDQNYIVRIFDDFFSEYYALMFEINLYETKLFQDTTVEGKHPGENNAFGGMGFIGKSEVFGQQWLYSRFDPANVSEILNMEIQKATLHIPRYNNNGPALTGYGLTARFCSFGSNWDNKIRETGMIAESKLSDKYCSLDITYLISDQKTGSFKHSEGLILKANMEKGAGSYLATASSYLAIATGDNYYTPQILEISASSIL